MHAFKPKIATNLPGNINHHNREALTRALSLFSETTRDPVDCLLAAMSAIEGTTVKSFDQTLLKQIALQAG